MVKDEMKEAAVRFRGLAGKELGNEMTRYVLGWAKRVYFHSCDGGKDHFIWHTAGEPNDCQPMVNNWNPATHIMDAMKAEDAATGGDRDLQQSYGKVLMRVIASKAEWMADLEWKVARATAAERCLALLLWKLRENFDER